MRRAVSSRGRATVQVYSAVQWPVYTAPDERQGSSDRISSGLTVHLSRADTRHLQHRGDNERREQAL